MYKLTYNYLTIQQRSAISAIKGNEAYTEWPKSQFTSNKTSTNIL